MITCLCMYAGSFILQSSFVFSVAPLEIIDGWRNQGIWETEVPNLGTGPLAGSSWAEPRSWQPILKITIANVVSRDRCINMQGGPEKRAMVFFRISNMGCEPTLGGSPSSFRLSSLPFPPSPAFAVLYPFPFPTVKMLRRPFIFWLYTCKTWLLTLIDSPTMHIIACGIYVTKTGESAHH